MSKFFYVLRWTVLSVVIWLGTAFFLYVACIHIDRMIDVGSEEAIAKSVSTLWVAASVIAGIAYMAGSSARELPAITREALSDLRQGHADTLFMLMSVLLLAIGVGLIDVKSETWSDLGQGLIGGGIFAAIDAGLSVFARRRKEGLLPGDGEGDLPPRG